MSLNERKTYPVQTSQPIHDGAQVNPLVYMAAYEVYCRVFGPQRKLSIQYETSGRDWIVREILGCFK